jgi:hypothetical protein
VTTKATATRAYQVWQQGFGPGLVYFNINLF